MLVCSHMNIPVPTKLKSMYDVWPIKRIMVKQCRGEWNDSAEKMSKLKTYCQIKDFVEPRALVKANCSRKDRSLVSCLYGGILAHEVETSQYIGIDSD